MGFISKSILTKFFVSLVVFALLLGVILFGMGYFNFEQVSLNVLIIILGIFFLYVVVTFLYFVVRPLRSVLTQMQLLMNGKKFKKIYTRRVDEVGVLAHFFNRVTESFTKVASDIKDRDRILDELAVAAELQKDIFPEAPPKVDGISIVSKNRPATEIGGDSYDFIESKDKVYIYVGDVTGHGVTAGLVMAMVNSMITSFSELYSSALDIVVHTNKGIKKYVKPSMYMTLVMLCWDKVAGKMTYVGAGHEHILVYRKEAGQIEDIVSGGTALGMVEDVSKSAQEKEIPLGKGDMVVLYTDGITEVKNKEGELYALERLKSSIMEYGAQYSASGVEHHIAQDLSAFVGDESQLDDMTLIVVEKT
jgi:serine phosphatase RsbU (regulator of sigma subunit)